MLRQVPPYRHGFDWHSSTSSEQVLPSNPFGQWHLKWPPGSDVHVPPLWHGDDEHRFCFSHSLPAKNLMLQECQYSRNFGTMKESPTQNETIADGTINIAIRLGKIVIFNARWYECLVCVCVCCCCWCISGRFFRDQQLKWQRNMQFSTQHQRKTKSRILSRHKKQKTTNLT